MDDEFKVFADGRPDVPPYRPEARARARERLLRQARGGFRLPRVSRQAVAAFGVTAALVGGMTVALTGQGQKGTSTTTSVTRTAAQYFPELQPRQGQFILIESDTMDGSFTMGEGGGIQTGYLYRTHRKFYQSVDGRADGLLFIEGREPKPWPGEEELPENVGEWRGSSWHSVASCPDLRGDRREDYAYLSGLPADPERIRERFYRGPGDEKRDADGRAFDEAAELVRESYLPAAQRQAVFEAVKGIPGIEEAQGVEDSAGRKGVALGRVIDGTLKQLIFDPQTKRLLGERTTVVDEKVARAPVGSVVALSAELDVTIVDKLPEVSAAGGDESCSPQYTEPQVTSTVTPVPEPTVTSTVTPVPEPTVTKVAPAPTG